MEWIKKSLAEQVGILRFLDFDMVSLHFCYRGQIPTAFLSPLTNHRTDEYGGISITFTSDTSVDILAELCAFAGMVNAGDVQAQAPKAKRGRKPKVDEGVDFLKLAEPYVDIVQFRASVIDPNHPTSFNPEHTPFLKYAENAKKSGLKMKVACVGGFHYFDEVEAAVAEGKLDIVSAGRAWVSNPNYGQLLLEGRDDDLVPCLRCNKCHGRGPHDPFVSVCSVNPLIGIEHRRKLLESEPLPSMRIAIIGGGPGGMKAAMDLCDRGHRVTIYEAEQELGGTIRHADFIDFKWTLKDYKNYLVHQIEKRDITVHTGVRATPDMIRSEGYDMVICALGASPDRPSFIPGLTKDHVMFAMDSILHTEIVGERVVVIGGGEVGMETGMDLALKGREMGPMLAPEATAIHYYSMFKEAWENIPNLHPITRARVTSVEDDCVRYVDADNAEHRVSCDSVVLSLGMTPRRDEALAFADCADRFALIGDCKKRGSVQSAIRQAYAISHSV